MQQQQAFPSAHSRYELQGRCKTGILFINAVQDQRFLTLKTSMFLHWKIDFQAGINRGRKELILWKPTDMAVTVNS